MYKEAPRSAPTMKVSVWPERWCAALAMLCLIWPILIALAPMKLISTPLLQFYFANATDGEYTPTLRLLIFCTTLPTGIGLALALSKLSLYFKASRAAEKFTHQTIHLLNSAGKWVVASGFFVTIGRLIQIYFLSHSLERKLAVFPMNVFLMGALTVGIGFLIIWFSRTVEYALHLQTETEGFI